MASTSKPWFEDSQLSAHTEFGAANDYWPKGTKGPGLADARETTVFLVKVLKPLRPLILAPILIMVLTGLIPYFSPFETDEAVLRYQVLYPLVSLPLWAFFFSLAKPARRLAVGESLSVQEALKDTLSVFLKVFVSTLVTTILLLITLASCALPFFLALPFLLRTPYEATKGLWPLEAISRSSKALFRSTTTTMLAAAALANAVIALALLRFVVSTLMLVGVPVFRLVKRLFPQANHLARYVPSTSFRVRRTEHRLED